MLKTAKLLIIFNNRIFIFYFSKFYVFLCNEN
jgi:hypothetical protein